MGVRIRKRLGYGYATNPDATSTVTDMLNLESFLFKEENLPFKNYEEAQEDYIAFGMKWEIEHEAQQVIVVDPGYLSSPYPLGKPKSILDLYSLVGRPDVDFATKDVFVLTPVGMFKEWYRFDDPIDYIEDMDLAQNYDLEEDVRIIPDGIHPYSGTYIRSDTLERLSPSIIAWIRARNDGAPRWASMDDLAQAAGFESHEEAQRLVIAKPCDDVVVLAQWAQVFKNPEDAYRMQAIYYKCWS